MSAAPAIHFADFTKYYGDFLAVDSLDLEVHTGEIFGFLGPNGAGKTTTIRAMLGLIRKTRGSIKVLGFDSEQDLQEIHRRIGYVPGDYGLPRNVRARGYLRDLSDLRGGGHQDRYEELADLLELDLEKKTKQLSKGNRQKLLILAGLMHEPDLVIFDEPTSALDPLIQQKVYQLLRDEAAAGRTIFCSSHWLSEVEQLCHRVAVIREGRLVVIQDIDELKDQAGKVIHVDFHEDLDPGALELTEVRSMNWITPRRAVLRVKGDLNRVLRVLADHSLSNLELQSPSLEELFMEYYSGEEE